MSLSGICVALSAALVYDKKTVVLSVLGTYFNGLVLDHFIFDHNIKRRVCIITKKEEALRRFILDDLHSGATVYESYGAYNMEKHREIITIVDKAEYQRLMNFMNREDPQAFITVYTVSDIRYQPKAQARTAPYLSLSVFLLLPGKRIYSKKQVTNPVRVWYTKYYNLVKTNLPGRGLQTLTPRCCRVLPEVLDYEFHIEPYAPPAGYAVFAAGAFLCGSTARPC